jgi:signal transduction histidine kinase
MPWSTVVPTAFVLLVLAALVLLPFVYSARVNPVREDMLTITNLHVEIALEGSLLSDFMDTRDDAVAQRYREAVASEEAATHALGALADRLREPVRAQYDTMLRLQEQWHRAADQALAAAAAGDPRRSDRARSGAYENLLVAVARLDDAIDTEAQAIQRRIVDNEEEMRRASVSLALLGLVATVVVGWLARRLRIHALDAEQRRVELEHAVEARARLMRGVSHDLKNPLHAIDGHAQLIEDGILGPLAPAQQDSIARIRRAVRSMLGLVDDLLELSRAEAGQLAVSTSSVDMAALLHEAVEEHRASARAAGHQLDLTITHDVPVIVTDPARVGQVLGNLLSNAVKYTPHGGHIVVRAEQRTRDGGARVRRWIAIDVVDDGPGIPEDQTETIFDEFARLARHADRPGSGLGLSIARRVAALLGGDITVGAETPQGTRFTLWLPAGGQPTPAHVPAAER